MFASARVKMPWPSRGFCINVSIYVNVAFKISWNILKLVFSIWAARRNRRRRRHCRWEYQTCRTPKEITIGKRKVVRMNKCIWKCALSMHANYECNSANANGFWRPLFAIVSPSWNRVSTQLRRAKCAANTSLACDFQHYFKKLWSERTARTLTHVQQSVRAYFLVRLIQYANTRCTRKAYFKA